MNIGIIGVGKVGIALITYLNKYGKEYNILLNSISSRNIEEAKTIALNNNIKCTEDLNQLVSQNDVIFVTTTDSAIENVVNYLKNNENLHEKVFIHCSGALSSDCFEPLISKGALGYSLHPLHAFAKENQDNGFESCFVTVEGNEDNESNTENEDDESNVVNTFVNEKHLLMSQILKLFQNRFTWINKDQKMLYHAAAVLLSNYSVTLFNEGFKYLSKIGFSEDNIRKMMLPLMEGTVKNVFTKGTVNGLTGPIVRGDDNVIKEHMKSINQYMGPEELKFYKYMGYKTVQMIKDEKLTKEKVEYFEVLFN